MLYQKDNICLFKRKQNARDLFFIQINPFILPELIYNKKAPPQFTMNREGVNIFSKLPASKISLFILPELFDNLITVNCSAGDEDTLDS